jgi:hypothetical protein
MNIPDTPKMTSRRIFPPIFENRSIGRRMKKNLLGVHSGDRPVPSILCPEGIKPYW